MGLVLLGRFSSLPEAHVVCSCLRAEGLNPTLMEGQFAWNLWTMREYLGGVAVWLPQAELEHALAALPSTASPEPAATRPRVRDDLLRFTPYALFALFGRDLAWAAAVIRSPSAGGWRRGWAWVLTGLAALVTVQIIVGIVTTLAMIAAPRPDAFG